MLPLTCLPASSPRIVTGRGALPPFDFANRQRCKKGARAAASPFSPSLYGEKCPAGR
ncbi:hypothetical protein MPL3356_70083 [Mesorhizobium plurifarium]|uniref:Uncharacterized protein n=1 Tax=Mesorhizobium plurifarium TaxID=69974 RepID=A0A090EGY8_MESPL|nr:hypothetical protein MPL3356_70083 [Mesorhizobium plurifarium]